MNILVVYGTTEGQTRKIASFMADRVHDRGEGVTLIDSTDVPKDLDVDGFDAVIALTSLPRHTPLLLKCLSCSRATRMYGGAKLTHPHQERADR